MASKSAPTGSPDVEDNRKRSQNDEAGRTSTIQKWTGQTGRETMIAILSKTARSAACAAAVACLGLMAPASAQPFNDKLKQLAQEAAKEGSLNLTWSQSTLGGVQGAERFQAAINKAFGIKLDIKFVPGPAMARVGNQLATEWQAKQKAHTDIMLGAAAQIAPLVKRDFFETVAWESYLPGRITDEMTELDGKIIRIVTGLSGATYNSKLAPMKPTKLEDFLKPEWKGKIASTPYAASFDVLLADDVWGLEKTTKYVTSLSSQISGLIRCGEAERIATGEFIALVMDCTGQDALQWQEKGAPLDQMVPLDAAQQRYYYFAVPKHAQHPNAAKLFAVFMLTPEGQKLSYDTWKTDLHFIPGSRMGKMVGDLKSAGVKFKEVTVEWWLKHPEIDKGKRSLVKILSTRK
jgi:ABC-type Fe3+ transport system substrate-binding protein